MAALQSTTRQKRKRHDAAKPASSAGGIAARSSSDMTEEQSFMAIQAMLRVSIASICWIRDLFPGDCFEKRHSTSLGDEIRYTSSPAAAGTAVNQRRISGSAFANQCSSSGTSVIDNSCNLMVLARGRTSQCDQLIRWLEVIIEGLKEKKVAAVNFSITKGGEDLSSVLELYTFFFEYRTDLQAGQQSLSSMSLSGTLGQTVGATSVREGLDPIVKRLILYSMHTPPQLPDKRFLSCHVKHSTNYTMEGFEQRRGQTILVPDKDDWRWTQVNLGLWNSGVHVVALSVAHVKFIGDEIDNLGSGTKTLSDIECTRVLPRFAMPLNHDEHQLCRKTSASTRRSRKLGLQISAKQRSARLDRVGYETVSGKGDHRTRAIQVNGNNTPFLELSKPPVASPQNSLVTTQELPADLRGDRPLPQWRLKPAKMQAIQERVNGGGRRSPASNYATKADVIRCQCSSVKSEGELIRCLGCDKLQHRHCYGFLTHVSVEQHVCYLCLLQEDPYAPRLKALKILAEKRRMLWLFYDQGWQPDNHGLVNKLGYDGDTTERYLNSLKEDGYLQPCGDSRLVLVNSLDQIRKRHEKFGNPMTHVAILYEAVKDTTPSLSTETSQTPPTKRPRSDRSEGKR